MEKVSEAEYLWRMELPGRSCPSKTRVYLQELETKSVHNLRSCEEPCTNFGAPNSRIPFLLRVPSTRYRITVHEFCSNNGVDILLIPFLQ